MKRHSPCQPISDISPCIVNGCNLSIFGVAIGNFAVAGFDLISDMSEVQQLLTRQLVHLDDKFVKVGRGDEILAMIDESLNRRRWSFTETAFDQKFPVFAREVRVLLRAR